MAGVSHRVCFSSPLLALGWGWGRSSPGVIPVGSAQLELETGELELGEDGQEELIRGWRPGNERFLILAEVIAGGTG